MLWKFTCLDNYESCAEQIDHWTCDVHVCGKRTLKLVFGIIGTVEPLITDTAGEFKFCPL
jgi:hypothetical protein